MIIKRTFISFVVKTCFRTLCKSATTCNIGKNKLDGKPTLSRAKHLNTRAVNSVELLGVPEGTKTPQFAK